VCLLAAGALVLGTLLYLAFRGHQRLQDAIAEADALDPGWRLAQLDEQRVRSADEDSSVLQGQAALRLIPAGWGSAPGYAELFKDLPPEAQLNEPQVAALRAELQKAAKARDEARKLADMPAGSFVINWTPDLLITNLSASQQVRQVVSLLRDDALLRAQEKDPDGAIRSLQAAVNGGRAVGDTPTALAQVVRIACVAEGTLSLERVLAQGEPSPAALEELQHVLEEEDRHSCLLVLARGERARLHQYLTWLELGNITSAQFAAATGCPITQDLALLLRLPGEMKREHAELLHYLNQAVEAAKQPEPQWTERLEELEPTARQLPPLPRLLVPDMLRPADADQRMHAQLQCAAVMLAAERFRREHNRWPASVQALVDDGYVRRAPTDPYDGAPLRLKSVEDGLVIYSVGPDGVDDGGKLDRTMKLPQGVDLGFRLWDLARRRQPSLPPKPTEAPGAALPDAGPPTEPRSEKP
jgi:hypothetical protein